MLLLPISLTRALLPRGGGIQMNPSNPRTTTQWTALIRTKIGGHIKVGRITRSEWAVRDE